MSRMSADVVICGAGISGIATAYHLAVRQQVSHVVIVDERAPLTLTSDKSTECYRNWWPGPGDDMVRFMNRSIDLMEDLADCSQNRFNLNRRGYVFLTADPSRASRMQEEAQGIARLGAGTLRIHRGRADDPIYPPPESHGYNRQLVGADLVLEPEHIRRQYPFISGAAVAMLHTRRCGWLSARGLGMYLLDEARAHGARLLAGRVTDLSSESGRLRSVQLRTSTGDVEIETRHFVNAAGPYLAEVGKLARVTLPVFNELHSKIAVNDTLGIIPRDAPLMIWEDPVYLFWTDEERAELAEDESTRWLLDQFPAGVHFRPEGAGDSRILLVLWTYHLAPQAVVWPPVFDPEHPEIVMRGLVRMVPGLKPILGRMEKPYVDGGYYCKTRENRPLIGPLPLAGTYVIGAVSGYGIMASLAGGELAAAYITGSELPPYAGAFRLDRYQDPAYQELLTHWDATSGQL